MSIWPTTFASVQNEANGSPIPSIWLIGNSKTGKSTFMASTLAKNPLILDYEGSWATLKFHVTGKVMDMRKEAAKVTDEKGQPVNILLANFIAFWNLINTIQPGQYDLIGIDGAEYLFEGSFQYLQKNPQILGKSGGQFSGIDGTKFGWGYAKNELWPHIVKTLESKCETVVFVTHGKDMIDKASKARNGRQTFKGVDMTELVTLALWLFNPENEDPDGNKPGTPAFKGKYWAVVKKHRLTWFHKQDNGFPRQYALLPTKLILQEGQSYPELIYGYMNAPQPDYGKLNEMASDPTRQTLSEEDKAMIATQTEEVKLEAFQAQLEETINEERNRITRELVGENKHFATTADLGTYMKSLGYDSYIDMRKALGSEAAFLELKKSATPAPEKVVVEDVSKMATEPAKPSPEAEAAAKLKAEAEAKEKILKAEQAAKDKAVAEEREAIMVDLVGEGKPFATATDLKDTIIMLGYQSYADIRNKLSFDEAVKLLHPQKTEPVLTTAEPVVNGKKK